MSLFDEKISHIISASIAGLDPQDREERIRHCQETGEHGVRASEDLEDLALTWGGRPLAVVPRDVLADDVPLDGLVTVFVPELD